MTVRQGDPDPLSLPGSTLAGGFWSHTKEFIPSVLVMMAFYTTFVTIFFFTYGKLVEKAVVEENARLLVDGLVRNISFFGSEISPDGMKKLQGALIDMKLPDTSSADRKVEKDNAKLVKSTFKVVLIGAAIALALAVLFWWLIVRRSWKSFGLNIVGKSVLLLLVVAITETAYFTLITKNYHSIDPSKAKKAMVDAMAAEIKKKVPPSPSPVENYNPVTMPLNKWQNFDNTLYLSGGVAAGPSEYVPGGIGAGTVVGGRVRQNPFTAMYGN